MWKIANLGYWAAHLCRAHILQGHTWVKLTLICCNCCQWSSSYPKISHIFLGISNKRCRLGLVCVWAPSRTVEWAHLVFYCSVGLIWNCSMSLIIIITKASPFEVNYLCLVFVLKFWLCWGAGYYMYWLLQRLSKLCYFDFPVRSCCSIQFLLFLLSPLNYLSCVCEGKPTCSNVDVKKAVYVPSSTQVL